MGIENREHLTGDDTSYFEESEQKNGNDIQNEVREQKEYDFEVGDLVRFVEGEHWKNGVVKNVYGDKVEVALEKNQNNYRVFDGVEREKLVKRDY